MSEDTQIQATETETEANVDRRHTVPTNNELVREIETSESVEMIGGRRDGSMFCQIMRLPDGFAYRPYGNQSSESWEWLRTEDFQRLFVAWPFADMQAIQLAMRELIKMNTKWRSRFNAAIRAMGPKSRKRLGKKMLKAFNND